jgi:hypothetical protein
MTAEGTVGAPPCKLLDAIFFDWPLLFMQLTNQTSDMAGQTHLTCRVKRLKYSIRLTNATFFDRHSTTICDQLSCESLLSQMSFSHQRMSLFAAWDFRLGLAFESPLFEKVFEIG